jgi:hypothetical protein
MRRLRVQTSRKTLPLQLEDDTYQQSPSEISNVFTYLLSVTDLPSFKQAPICKCIRLKTAYFRHHT